MPSKVLNQGLTPVPGLRIWPAVLIALVQLSGAWGFGKLASINTQIVMVSGLLPLVTSLLLIIWWLGASRAPWRDRLAGAAIYIAVLALPAGLQQSLTMGALLLTLVLPACTLTLALTLVLTCRVTWSVRRRLLVLSLLLCSGIFCARRVDSIGGDLAPVVSWRWTVTADERVAAMPSEESAEEAALLPVEIADSDWPAFRGPERDGRLVDPAVTLLSDRPARELWRRSVGPAWSSFAAVGNYLFTQEQRGDQELVTCYHAATGKLIWINRVDARFEDALGLGPRATPTYDRGRLYTQGCTGILQCLDAATGRTLWQHDLKQETEGRTPHYGFCSSPLVVGDLVIQASGSSAGKALFAFRSESGELVWTAGHGATSYSSPQLAVLDGVTQVLLVSNEGLQAFDAGSGAPLWEHVWKIGSYPRCTQPLVFGGNRVLLGATANVGTRLFQVVRKESAWEVSEVWFSKTFRPYFNDGVDYKGFYYGFDGERLVCLDLATGERRWRGPRCGGQLLLVPGSEMFLILTEKGKVVYVPASPEAFSEAASFQALSGKTWNHPIIAHGRLYVRNSQTAACYELSAAPPAGDKNRR